MDTLKEDFELTNPNLRLDFENFSKLRSWYKHNKLYGTTFYVYKDIGQQLKTGDQIQLAFGNLNLNSYDMSGVHWHFSIEQPINTKFYKVKFNCFLRGLEGRSKYAWGFWIIYEDYKDIFHTWILEHYPEYKDIDWNKEILEKDIHSSIIKELYTKEYNRQWNDLCKAMV